MSREKAELSSQVMENEEDLQDVMRKYKASVAAVSTDQITIQDQASTIADLEDERNKLKEHLAELSTKVEALQVRISEIILWLFYQIFMINLCPRETASRLLSIKSLSSKFGSWRLNWSLRKQRGVGWRHS